MSAINGIGSNNPVQKIQTTPVMKEVQATQLPKQLPLTDRVELSGVSHLLATLKANSAVNTVIHTVPTRGPRWPASSRLRLPAASHRAGRTATKI